MYEEDKKREEVTLPEITVEYVEETGSGANHDSRNTRGRKTGPRKKLGFIGKSLCAAVIIGGISGGMVLGSFALGSNITSSASATTTSAALSTVSGSSGSTGSSESSGSSYSVSQIASKCTSSVVAITNKSVTETQNMFGQNTMSESESAGSGVIISQSGGKVYIVTNYHVIEDAETLTVCFNDSKKYVYKASVVGTDEENDLAVISVSTKSMSSAALKSITVATIGDSSKSSVGDQVVAIGNALGYGQSVTSGYISALNKEVTVSDSGTTQTLIQTDAAINPGNSGGALFNMQGELIGINSAKYSDTSVEGMGFAIPMSKAESIIKNLMKGNSNAKLTNGYGYLGIYGQDVDSSDSESYNIPQGVYVSQVLSGSAAETAGLQKGDVITGLGSKTITSMSQLQSALQYYKGGTKVKITYYRSSNGSYSKKTVSVTLGTASSSSSSSSSGNSSRSGSNSETYGNSENSRDYSQYFGSGQGSSQNYGY
ncbi:MAG: trypsin-like peptidase domain-containing protein [Lachnospiraceae bacterium]|jgi:serine protease Do|nr:trypsin-like peptidase domain-containing protein [Lachnospiraceae bacterium]MCI1658108.1 trypsin-like peptidase domain-containing protein [Lachnospiraceae bacterium]